MRELLSETTGASDQQMVGLAVMLAITARYLPDDVLTDLVQGVGGPNTFVEILITVEIAIPQPMQGVLLTEAHDVLRRLRERARAQSSQTADRQPS